MTYDKEKFERIQVLLPKEYLSKLDKVKGVFKRSPYIVNLVVKHIDEEEKKNPDRFK